MPSVRVEEPRSAEQRAWAVLVVTAVLRGLLRLADAVFGLPDWTGPFLWKPLGVLLLVAAVVLVSSWLQREDQGREC